MTTLDHAAPHAGGHHAEEHAHPGARTYIAIGGVLAAITVIEIWLSYITLPRPVFITLLLVLSAAKFVLVVGFYMHLKFDHAYFRYMFGFGMLIAISIVLSLMLLFTIHPHPPMPAPTLPAH